VRSAAKGKAQQSSTRGGPRARRKCRQHLPSRLEITDRTVCLPAQSLSIERPLERPLFGQLESEAKAARESKGLATAIPETNGVIATLVVFSASTLYTSGLI
jgi:hypothetical protein